MYIWVVLATFLAILASYTLSPREDIRKLTVEPLAEVFIAKMVTQHEAALAYAKYWKKADQEFAPIELKQNELDKYFPAGHYYGYGNGNGNGNDIATRIYCMDQTGSTKSSGNCKAGDGGKIALITYSHIPLRWLNTHVDPERPNVDFLNAMKNTIDSGVTFGYIAPTDDTSSEKNISGSHVLIVDRDNSENYLYKAIADDADFREMCDVTEEGKICLVYQSNL